MSLNKIFWILLLLTLVIGQQQAGTAWGKERTWTDDSGAFTLVAELVEVRGDKVILRRQDGEQITVPLAKLSKKGRQFVVQRPVQKVRLLPQNPPPCCWPSWPW